MFLTTIDPSLLSFERCGRRGDPAVCPKRQQNAQNIAGDLQSKKRVERRGGCRGFGERGEYEPLGFFQTFQRDDGDESDSVSKTPPPARSETFDDR